MRCPVGRFSAPRLRAARIVLSASRLSSLPMPRTGKREHPEAFSQTETRPPDRRDTARRNTAPAPQSKPVTPASRLVAQVAPLVAFGLGASILAAGPAVHRLYSHRGRLCEPDPSSLPGRVAGAGIGLIRATAPARLPEACSPEISERDRDTGSPNAGGIAYRGRRRLRAGAERIRGRAR